MNCFRCVLLATIAALGVACTVVSPPSGVVGGELDLRSRDWTQGPVVLEGAWSFESGQRSSFRSVPDTWQGSDAGGLDGRGTGTYQLRVLVGEKAPALALRYQTASTAFLVRANGVEVAHSGNPDADPKLARPAYLPGTVVLPVGPVIDLEVFVSNHEYRVGGLWSAPTLGPVGVQEGGRWADEAGALTLATAIGAIGFSSLLLFVFRRSEKTFLHLGIFALLIALRSLVTGEYPLVRIFPLMPFDALIRLEYLSAFLPLPSAALFFVRFYPGLMGPWGLRLMTWPSWAFALLTLVLPLDLLTRCIPFFYPFAGPALVIGTTLLVMRILKEKGGLWLLLGVAVLATTGLVDMVRAAFFATTSTFIPWGLGIFVALQATTLARRFLSAFEATEALLAEKDLLIREIHHRVKNSLQVVASLVTLQGSRLDDPALKSVFVKLRQRITAIALVHEKLYGQGIDGSPDMGDYLRELLQLQYPPDGLGTDTMSWDISDQPMAAGIDNCVDAGLILTELVGNAHRHGRTRGGSHIHVTMTMSGGRMQLEVVDEGQGFAPDFNPEASRGLGFRLVVALLQRNDGKLTFPPGKGGRVLVDLRLARGGG